MSVLFHVLKEEEQRLQETIRGYKNLIAEMPKGSLRRKKIKNSHYYYLVYRLGTKIISDYIGAIDSEKAQSLIAVIENRDRYSVKLREAQKALKEIQKVLRGK